MQDPYFPPSAPELGGIEALLAEFDRADRPDRFSQVLQKLRRCRENVVPELLNRLDTEDLAQAKKTALALGYLRSPQAIPALVAIASDPERATFTHAITALSHIGNNESLNYLIGFLTNPSVQIQAAAARVLGKTNLTAAPALVDALKRGDDLVKINAAHSLGQLGAPVAVTTLIDLLTYPVSAIRQEAAWALGQIRSPLAAAPLANLLNDPDLGIQAQAIAALKNIGMPALAPLAQHLQHPSSDLRSIAARTLGQMAIEDSIPLLAQLLKTETNPYVLLEVVNALGETGAATQSYEAVYYLSPLLGHSDRALRNAAARSLKQINSLEAQEILRVSQLQHLKSQRPKSQVTMDNVLDDMTVIQW
ncbi:MAG: HEAT repeat domain-containing protein [Pseudanabaenaceae cyanobacterium bins.68]|nr:HEAT repeat domain-containing protein [Pseudanabaenaceae cyanobacterium bins.68]